MRYELSDGEWATIRPMLPNKARGVPRVDDRRTTTIAGPMGIVPKLKQSAVGRRICRNASARDAGAP